MDMLLKDLRFALRTLRRRPVFTAVAVLSLALGIGANAVIFSMVNGLLWRPPPGVEEEGELVRIYTRRQSFDWPLGVSYPDYRDLRAATGGLVSDLAAHSPLNFNLVQGNERPRIAWGFAVAGNYFATLGTTPALGRLFGAAEGEGREPVLVVSHGFWRQRLGADPAAIGSSLKLDGQSYIVAGVVPPGFFGTEVIFAPDLWVPLESVPRAAELLEERASDPLRLTGRLRPGVGIEQLQARLALLSESLAEEYPEQNRDASFHAIPNSEARIEAGLGGPMKMIASILLVLVGLVLLIACANVANLMLARARARRREMSLRVALGAGRGRLVRQQLVESGLLAVAGGVVGALIAVLTARAIESYPLPTSLPLRLELSPDLRVFLSTGVLVLLAAVAFGVAPALKSARTDPSRGLREGAMGSGVGGRLRAGSLLVVGQTGLSLILLVSAGLFLRSLQQAQAVDLGLEPRDAVAMTVDLSPLGRSPGEARQFFETAKRRLAELPGVEGVSVARWVPMDWSASGDLYGVGRDLGGEIGDELLTLGSWVDADYFATLGTTLVEGRPFTLADEEAEAAVIIVNRAFAELVWPQETALGRELRIGGREGRPVEVIGVAETGKYRLLGESPRPYAFQPLYMDRQPAATLVLRSRQPAGSLLEMAQAELAHLEPDVAVMNAAPLAASISARALAPIQLVAILAGAFGLVGLTLASIGLYGVVALLVAERTREIGVRLALGARSGQVLGGVLRQGLQLAAVGLVLGVVSSLALSRMLGSFLVGVSSQDPATFGGVVAILLLVAVLASLVPALRAARIDPVRTLKAE